MTEKLTYLGFRDFSDRHFHYELIGTGLILSFFMKSQKLVLTTFNTGKVVKEVFLKDEEILRSYDDFIYIAKTTFLRMIEERAQEIEKLTTLN